VINVPEPTTALMAPAATPANAIRIMWATDTRATLVRCPQPRSSVRQASRRSGA
jgi:hypothetical protein